MEKRKVLVPVDGSDFGRQIFPILSKFIDPASSELILLRVGDPVGGHTGAPPRPTSTDGMVLAYDTPADAEFAQHPIYASQERESALADFISEMKADAIPLEEAGFAVRYELRFGNRGEEIVNYVSTHDVDLIAITTHWRTGINRLLFGNTVQYVTPRIHVPLLMLRPAEAETE